MQLGTRWAVGETPPANLPEVVTYAVSTVEEELTATDIATEGWRWTLTWLEGNPVVELDDGTVIRYNAHEDSATITQQVETESSDWDEAERAGAGQPGARLSAAAAGACARRGRGSARRWRPGRRDGSGGPAGASPTRRGRDRAGVLRGG